MRLFDSEILMRNRAFLINVTSVPWCTVVIFKRTAVVANVRVVATVTLFPRLDNLITHVTGLRFGLGSSSTTQLPFQLNQAVSTVHAQCITSRSSQRLSPPFSLWDPLLGWCRRYTTNFRLSLHNIYGRPPDNPRTVSIQESLVI